MNKQLKNSGIEWVGEVPQHWKAGYLNQYFIQIKNKNTNLQENNLLSLSYGKIIQKDINSKEGLLPEKFDGYNIIKSGDIVLRLTDLQNDHKSLRVGWSSQRGIITSAYITLRKKSNEIHDKFAYYFLHSFDLSKGFYGMGSGVRQGLTYNGLKKLEFVFPVYKEQQKIANILDETLSQIDSLIEKTKLSIEELKKYKQSFISETVTKGLNPYIEMKDSGIGYIGLIPKDWSVTKLRYLGTLQNGISKSSDFFGEGYPFVSYGDVYRNIELPEKVDGLVQSSESERDSYSVKYGDVFFTRTSETIEEVGFASTCLNKIKDAVFAGFVIRYRPFDNRLNPNFSKYYFRSNIHRSFFVKEMNLVTRASLSQELLKKLPVLLPSITEQVKIAEFLDNKCNYIDNLVNKKEQLIVELKEYKKTLIYEYVTGKKEVL